MKRVALATSVLIVIALAGAAARMPVAQLQAPTAKVANQIAFKAVSFNLEDVRLLDGPFKDAMVRDGKYLLELEPDRLLHMFRVTAGLPSPAQPYTQGWETPDTELRGHTTGHYLSALAIMYASTGDRRFKDRADLLVTELNKVQQAEATKFNAGYLSAFPEEFFDRVDKRVNVWAPYYTIHKIMAGLFDVFQLCHNDLALEMLKKQAAWVRFRVDRLSYDQQQAALQTEFGGMGEVLANLAGVTGDREWLRIAQKFDHQRLFDPLAEGRDPLVDENGRGLHGNTQIPKMIASAREYELTADLRYKAIATNFWHTVVEKRSYVIGGNTDGESFFPVDAFEQHLGTSSAETCNTYNMLKLTRHLFSWEPSAEAMDYYERALLNQILPSQDPKTGGVVYYTPLRPGAFKVFSLPNDSFWCCVGTGMENHGKYNDTIYFHDDRSLYLNLFIPSELTWKAKGLSVRQETRFPIEDTTRLTITASQPVTLSLKVRYPAWAAGMTLAVNGRTVAATGAPGFYVTVSREWKTGDTVSVRLPMALHVEALPNSTRFAAFMYGPVVLAGDLGSAGMDNARRYGSNTPQGTLVPPAAHVDIPVFVSADLTRDLAKITPVPGAPLTFKATGMSRPTDVTLVPFFTLFEPRYTIYWKVYTPADWDARTRAADADAARRKSLESRTIDAVDVGSDQSEQTHEMAGQTAVGRGRSSGTVTGAITIPSAPPVGPIGATMFDGRRGREARGGFVSYALKVAPGQPTTLAVTYRVEGGNQPRTFDVLVDGTKIATETFATRPGEFFDKEYPLAADVTRGKSRVIVRFESTGTTATIFDVRTVSQLLNPRRPM